MMAGLSPPGYDNIMIGSNVIRAIIDKSGNSRMGLPSLFAFCVSTRFVTWFAVGVGKGRIGAENGRGRLG
ncbi:hypothetical protein P691DRAFT_715516 [Macrolepiota fuliginosa MF-IS2]|uniref:Uncharacterized protein n=1 Tax=Macrolepiota fuliginosa MF-IS2 TaxID=1400762 RepID=A0A9P5WZ95_9AGAR|nr:hypothetical protein P691DRAFT_715516 [Macrolepiota fuliginosa MF-IS2]